MALIDHHEGIVLLCQVTDLIHRSDVAVHGEDPVGDDDAEACGLGFLEDALEVLHVGVLIAVALSLAQTHAVDDGGVVQGVADDSVLRAKERLEEPAIGIEARSVEDGVLGVEVTGDGLLQLLVQILRAADEAHRAHAEAMAIHSCLGRSHEAGVVGEPEVVISTEVDDVLSRADLDVGRLWGDDDALTLVEPSLIDGLQFLGEELLHACEHSTCVLM